DALDDAVRLLAEVEAERQRLRSLLALQSGFTSDLELTDQRLQREVRTLETELESVALSSGPAPRSAPAVFADSGFDSLEMDRYTELHERSRALAESAGDLETVRADVSRQLVAMDHSVERLEGSTLQLRDRLLALRLVPFSVLKGRLEGVVRVAARALEKSARLEIEDRGVELDKDVLDALIDPLDHLLRNAVAHGVEAPEERRSLGKSARAVIRLEAAYVGSEVQLTLSDDGRGIDAEAVRRRAVERGVVSAERVASWSESQLHELIFEPGLSTAAQIDRIAGRGVGMDVVRESVRELRGRVRVESSPGEGTAVILQTPTSLAVQRVLIVRDGGRVLAVPSDGLERLERLETKSVERVGDHQILRSGGEIYRILRLAASAGLAEDSGAAIAADGQIAILGRSGDSGGTAIVVEELIGGREVVVQDLGRHLLRLRGLLGVTQTGAGLPVPILDPSAWAEGGEAARPRAAPARPGERPRAPANREVLVVDDSLSMRRYLSQLVSRFGFDGIEARDGRDALDQLDAGSVSPHLVLLDLEMPRMDGFELMEVLGGDGRYSHLPKVVLSSRGAEKHRRRAFDAGADAYLVKPVAEPELESTLKRLVGGVAS
ncbi:MAG: response regulator, partial [Acidobacteriota bacterium]